jgi:hypothetical protein
VAGSQWGREVVMLNNNNIDKLKILLLLRALFLCIITRKCFKTKG